MTSPPHAAGDSPSCDHFLGVPPDPESPPRVAILPVPYELSVSYGRGCGQGPDAILRASRQVEFFDEELGFCPRRLGIATLPPLPLAGRGPQEMMACVHQAALEQLQQGRFLIALGGEHTITAPLLAAHLAHGDPPFTLLHLDAHADLRPTYQGDPHSHACVMRRVFDMGIPMVSVGLRSMSGLEWRFIEEHRLDPFLARDLLGESAWMDQVIRRLGRRVYISVDVDVLDPAIMPATGTPEPGGLDFVTLTTLLRKVCAEREVVGCDVTELAPIPGFHAADFTVARLVHKLIGYRFQGTNVPRWEG